MSEDLQKTDLPADELASDTDIDTELTTDIDGDIGDDINDNSGTDIADESADLGVEEQNSTIETKPLTPDDLNKLRKDEIPDPVTRDELITKFRPELPPKLPYDKKHTS